MCPALSIINKIVVSLLQGLAVSAITFLSEHCRNACRMAKKKNPAAVQLGRKGGRASAERLTDSSESAKLERRRKRDAKRQKYAMGKRPK
jgi:hypothetical protein